MCMRFAALKIFLLLLSCGIWAQGTISVPADLSSNFDPGAISLQVNFAGKAEFGFTDGTQFSIQDTSKVPVFALGDASGVNTAISFLVMMLDTTTENRVVHFLQPDIKANGDETAISSSSPPAFSYRGPGTLGETGVRQYSFLLYQQIGTFQAKSIPSAGQTIDVHQFQSDNGLKDADAGVVMVVDITSDSTTSAPESTSMLTTAAVVTRTTTSITSTPNSTPPQIISVTTTIPIASIPSVTLPISFQSTPFLSLVGTISSEAFPSTNLLPSTSLTDGSAVVTAVSSRPSNPISSQVTTSNGSGNSSTSASLSAATVTNSGYSRFISRGSLSAIMALPLLLTIYYV